MTFDAYYYKDYAGEIVLVLVTHTL